MSRRLNHLCLVTTLLLAVVASLAWSKPTRTRPVPSGGPPASRHATLLPGDDFSTAIEISGLPFSTTLDLCPMSNDIDLFTCTTAIGPDLVHAFSPATDMRIYASTCGAFGSPALVLFEEGVPGPLDCGAGTCGSFDPGFGEIRYTLQAGHRYYFVIKAYDAVCAGPVPFSIVQPTPVAGEDAASAIEIPSLPFSATGSTILAWPDVLNQCVSEDSPDVFYRFTPLTPTCADISLCGLDHYDTALMLFEQGNGTPIACSDDDCPDGGLLSRLPNQLLLPGTTYFIVVSGFLRSAGSYALEMTHCGPVASRASSWGQLKQIYR